MAIEIQCPGCRFLLRADDEFAGESAPCPYCGANIAVPRPRPTQITDSIAHQGPAPDERVSRDPRQGNSFPLRRRLPIPQHGEPRPIPEIEPDEDHPPLPPPPPSPRMQAVYNFLWSNVLCLGVFWGAAYWKHEEHPVQAVIVSLCGMYLFVGLVKDLRETWARNLPAEDEEEWLSKAQPISTAHRVFWVPFVLLMLGAIVYGLYLGIIIVLAIPFGVKLILHLVVPRRYWHQDSISPSRDSSRKRDELESSRPDL